jgi:hypothetical protein
MMFFAPQFPIYLRLADYSWFELNPHYYLTAHTIRQALKP